MSTLSLTVQDLPAMRDQIDTIAEHDLSDAPDESPAVRDATSDAVQALREARRKIMDAIDALRRAGVVFDDDDADQ